MDISFDVGVHNNRGSMDISFDVGGHNNRGSMDISFDVGDIIIGVQWTFPLM